MSSTCPLGGNLGPFSSSDGSGLSSDVLHLSAYVLGSRPRRFGLASVLLVQMSSEILSTSSQVLFGVAPPWARPPSSGPPFPTSSLRLPCPPPPLHCPRPPIFSRVLFVGETSSSSSRRFSRATQLLRCRLTIPGIFPGLNVAGTECACLT